MKALYCVAMATGILLSGLLPQLPSWLWVACLFVSLCLLIYWLPSRYRLLLCLLFGFCWGIAFGLITLAHQLSPSLIGKEILVTGKVVALPTVNHERARFLFEVEQALTTHQSISLASFPKKLQLTWFSSPPRELASGSRWQLLVKLKPMRGFVNPQGFDYQVWQLRRGVLASGQVVPHTVNQILNPASLWSMDRLRQLLREQILSQSLMNHQGIAIALLLGDRTYLNKDSWQTLFKTGTNHLMAISGMHVSLVAWLGYGVGSLLGRLMILLSLARRVRLIAISVSMSVAIFYSLLAGLSLPTQRALIMLLVVYGFILLGKTYKAKDVLAFALLLVTLCDPLALFDSGFWLSFGAVSILLVSFSGRAAGFKREVMAASLVKAQSFILIGLSVPLIILINSFSLYAPLANLYAIPLVTFWVVPLLLMAAICDLLNGGLAQYLYLAADFGLEILLTFNQRLLNLGSENFNPIVSLSGVVALLALVGCGLLLMPKGLRVGYLGGAIVIFIWLMPQKPLPPLTLTFLDVGQGLSVLIKTPSYQLLYDTGPRFSESFDAGSAIVVPFLYTQNIKQLDAIVISHNDGDHVGGLSGVIEQIPVKNIYWGEASLLTDSLIERKFKPREFNCHQTPKWQVDQVGFEFLHWPIPADASSNNQSCVLQISYAGKTILLTGDIEKQAEALLINANVLPQKIDLLLAAHHGSRTSSSVSFLDYITAENVIISAGYLSQYGHPHGTVIARFNAKGSQLFNTAHTGAITWQVQKNGEAVIELARNAQRRYWFAQD